MPRPREQSLPRKKHARGTLLAAGLIICAAGTHAQPAAPHPLTDYLAQSDASYHWKQLCGAKYRGGEYAELLLTSQTWHGILWRHQLFIIRPDNAPAHPQAATLFITGGHWHARYLHSPSRCPDNPDAQVFQALASALGMPLAVLKQIPEEPLFGGKTEDTLIAYSFQQYLKTADDTWPLLLPMVNSAAHAMDAVQSYAKQRWHADIRSFLVTGVSKRGWTTWLTAAVDPRVKALAPMSFTMLDIPAQLKLQQASWGRLSDEIADYSRTGLTQKMQSGTAANLLAIVDPWHYRAEITQPKLIIDGTNDPYWPVDSVNVFWPGLRAPKYLLYLPNNRHSPQDLRRVFGDLAALARDLQSGTALPKLAWQVKRRGQAAVLTLHSDPAPQRVRVWRAYAPQNDFRGSLWLKTPLACEHGVCRWRTHAARTAWTAFFAEAKYRGGHYLPYFLATTVTLLPPAAGPK